MSVNSSQELPLGKYLRDDKRLKNFLQHVAEEDFAEAQYVRKVWTDHLYILGMLGLHDLKKQLLDIVREMINMNRVNKKLLDAIR